MSEKRKLDVESHFDQPEDQNENGKKDKKNKKFDAKNKKHSKKNKF